MIAILKIAELIRHGKILTVVKPFLSVIMVAGITYAIYHKRYGAVVLPDEFSLKKTSEYFLNGDFIVPFGIFFFVWAMTSIICGAFFDLINSKITDWIWKHINPLNFIDPTRTVEDAKLNAGTLVGVPRKQWAVRMYEAVRNKINNQKIEEINKRLQLAQLEYASDFVLIIRSIIAIVIYFNSVTYFGWILFLALMLLEIVLIVLTFIGFQFSALLPMVASKYTEEYKKHERQEKLLLGNETSPKS